MPREALATLPTAAVLDRLFAGAPVGLALFDRERRVARVNPALARMNRLPVEAHLGREVHEVFGDSGAAVAAILDDVIRTAQPVLGVELAGAPGRPDHFLASYAPVLDADGDVLGVVAVVQDVTLRWRAELELERSLERVTRLQRVTAALSAALTVDAVAEVIITESMAAIGASCGVLALREGEEMLAVRHRFGMEGRNAPGFLPLSAQAPMPAAARAGAPVLLASRADWLSRFPAVPPRGDFDAFAAVPLRFEAESAGVMGLGLPYTGHPPDADVSMLEAIAQQGAQALERARLYDEREAVARELQRGLLPGRLPFAPPAELAVRYRPVAGGGMVSGDFYDVVELDGGRWFVVVGDVCGKGVPAATLSATARATIAGLALQTAEPDEVLELANRAIRRGGEAGRYVTVVCATLHEEGDALVATIGSAGHPPPLVIRAAGGVEEIQAPGAMLGVHDALGVQPRAVRLAPGDVLVLYTDGITDARVDGERFGEARLRATLEPLTGRAAHDVVAAVGAAVEAYKPGPAADDEAVLAIRVTPAPARRA